MTGTGRDRRHSGWQRGVGHEPLANIVSVIDLSSNAIAHTIPIAGNPSGIAITPNGDFAFAAKVLDGGWWHRSMRSRIHPPSSAHRRSAAPHRASPSARTGVLLCLQPIGNSVSVHRHLRRTAGSSRDDSADRRPGRRHVPSQRDARVRGAPVRERDGPAERRGVGDQYDHRRRRPSSVRPIVVEMLPSGIASTLATARSSTSPIRPARACRSSPPRRMRS